MTVIQYSNWYCAGYCLGTKSDAFHRVCAIVVSIKWPKSARYDFLWGENYSTLCRWEESAREGFCGKITQLLSHWRNGMAPNLHVQIRNGTQTENNSFIRGRVRLTSPHNFLTIANHKRFEIVIFDVSVLFPLFFLLIFGETTTTTIENNKTAPN